MNEQDRRSAYASLWGLAVAFGWIEASVVVYLREIAAARTALQAPNAFPAFQVSLGSLPGLIVFVEMVRDACAVLVLAGVAWLAGRRTTERVGAFLLAFGVWDLTYYAVLKLVIGWPHTLRAWDVLYLIPVPWVAPVWAPIVVAAIFVAAGSYLFWTPARERSYGRVDVAVLIAAVSLTVAAFLVDSRAVSDRRVTPEFPVWLFWAGVVLGTLWFVWAETRGMGAGVGPLVPVRRKPAAPQGADEARLIQEYATARRRLNALVAEAADLAERFERLAHGLAAHPARLLVGPSSRTTDSPGEWDVVPAQPLPSIEGVAALTNEIREARQTVGALRERLVLTGSAAALEQPDGFFR